MSRLHHQQNLDFYTFQFKNFKNTGLFETHTLKYYDNLPLCFRWFVMEGFYAQPILRACLDCLTFLQHTQNLLNSFSQLTKNFALAVHPLAQFVYFDNVL